MKTRLSLRFVTGIICLFLSQNVLAQGVAINDGDPVSDADPSAMLDVSASDKGILIPRLTWSNRPSSPAEALLIYSTDGDGSNGAGFYYYDGSGWNKLFDPNGDDNDWTMSGDDLLSNNSGNIGIGTTPDKKLDVNGNIRIRGNEIFGDPSGDGQFIINNTGNIRMRIDSDDDGSQEFQVRGSSGNCLTITEGGNMEITGDLTISEGASPTLDFSQGGGNITSPTSVNITIDDDDNASITSFSVNHDASASLFEVHETGKIKVPPLASAPSSGNEGEFYTNSTDNRAYYFNGNEWRPITNDSVQTIKLHRTTTDDNITTESWTDCSSFSKITSESNGSALSLNADNKSVDINQDGFYQFGGCLHVENNTGSIFSGVTVFSRLVKDDGVTTTELRCSQRGYIKDIAASGEDIISYNGTVYLEEGDQVRLQYYTDESNLEFYSNAAFDDRVAYTLWFIRTGNY